MSKKYKGSKLLVTYLVLIINTVLTTSAQLSRPGQEKDPEVNHFYDDINNSIPGEVNSFPVKQIL